MKKIFLFFTLCPLLAFADVSVDTEAIVRKGFVANKVSDVDFGNIVSMVEDDDKNLEMAHTGEISSPSDNLYSVAGMGIVGEIDIYGGSGMSLNFSNIPDTQLKNVNDASKFLKYKVDCWFNSDTTGVNNTGNPGPFRIGSNGKAKVFCGGNLSNFYSAGSGIFRGSFGLTISF